jgi:redox-sensitive bicupin YhaK (pirin superfamily)
MLIKNMSKAIGAAILTSRAIPPGPMPTLDPFLFCVYHKDNYPPGNAAMEAPRRGNGQDFNPSADYRMYHGEKIPGFPNHPHRGFETITATMDGIIDHADSVGNAGRYGMGDVQWMTAGGGVVHSETFPLLKQKEDNPTRFFQIWLNLPAKSKMVNPGFAMFWANEVPKWTSPDGKAAVTVWAGQYFGVDKNNAPPNDSWASDPANDVAILHMTIQPGGTLTLPAAHTAANVSRSMFYIEGGADSMKVDGKAIDSKVVMTIKADQDIELTMDEAAAGHGEFLLLQGKPIKEPVKQHGPFVMNTDAEIQQAFMDYQRTQFGRWPWPRDDMVFPRDKGRFAKLNGKETSPPDATCID